jgi:DNA-binding MarR family transcriptional regulator
MDTRPDTPTVPVIACTCTSVRRTGRMLGQLYDTIMAPSGLRNTQFALLNRIDQETPVSMGDLAELLAMDRTTLTRALAPLERQGWVLVEAGTDRRTRQVRLTASGEATREAARPLWRQAQAHVAMKFGEERLAALRQELAALAAIAR